MGMTWNCTKFCNCFANDFGPTFCAAFNVIITGIPVAFLYVGLTVQSLHFLILLVFLGISLISIFLILAVLPQDARTQILTRELLTQMKRGIRATNEVIKSTNVSRTMVACGGMRRSSDGRRPLHCIPWASGLGSLEFVHLNRRKS